MAGVTWQWIAILLIEVGAILFLLRRLFGRATPPVKRGPDVSTRALLRKKR